MSSLFSKGSKSEGQKTLIDAVVNLINDSNTMEYLWSQKTDDVKHTGIVIKFDYTPKFTLDFGGDFSTAGARIKVVATLLSGSILSRGKMQRAVSRMILSGRVTISDFSSADIKIKGRLVELSLRTTVEKENAINLFTHIKHIDAGDYQLMENNCRTYVITVAYVLSELPEFRSEDFSDFEQQMQTLRSEDQTKFEKCWETAKMLIQQKRKAINHLSQEESYEETSDAEKLKQELL